jgi:hypothetical protein
MSTLSYYTLNYEVENPTLKFSAGFFYFLEIYKYASLLQFLRQIIND